MRSPLIALFSVALLAPAIGLAEPGHHAVSLALLYPISTNQDPDISTNLRLSLLYGRVGSVHGIDLNGVAALTSRDVKGVQFNGLYSQVGGDMKGLQWTGAVNYVRGDVGGLQIAYLGNVNRGAVTGLQFGGLFNLVGGQLYGAQAAAVINTVDGDAGFIQWSGVAGSVGGDFEGFQASGGYAFVGGRMAGVQLALVNFATEMAGVQAGGANFTRQSGGLQLGAFNWAREQTGVPVGMVNATTGGEITWVTYASNLSPFNTGIETEVRGFYSMLTMGGHDSKGDVRDALVLTWNYGRAFPVANKTRIGADLGFSHYIPAKENDPTLNDRLHYAIQARGLVERRFGPRTAAFVGGGVARIYSDYSADAVGDTEPIFFGGVSLF